LKGDSERISAVKMKFEDNFVEILSELENLLQFVRHIAMLLERSIQKGSLCLVSQSLWRGLACVVLDDRNNVVEGGCVWMSGRKYGVDAPVRESANSPMVLLSSQSLPQE
jgi:hypothetical protein